MKTFETDTIDSSFARKLNASRQSLNSKEDFVGINDLKKAIKLNEQKYLN
jgi:hypothetical protein